MIKLFVYLTILIFAFNSCLSQEKKQPNMKFFESSFIDQSTNKNESINFFFVQINDSLFFSNTNEIESDKRTFIASLSNMGTQKIEQIKCENEQKLPYFAGSRVTKVSDTTFNIKIIINMLNNTHIGFEVIKVFSFKYQNQKTIYDFQQKTCLEEFSLFYQNPWDCPK